MRAVNFHGKEGEFLFGLMLSLSKYEAVAQRSELPPSPFDRLRVRTARLGKQHERDRLHSALLRRQLLRRHDAGITRAPDCRAQQRSLRGIHEEPQISSLGLLGILRTHYRRHRRRAPDQGLVASEEGSVDQGRSPSPAATRAQSPVQSSPFDRPHGQNGKPPFGLMLSVSKHKAAAQHQMVPSSPFERLRVRTAALALSAPYAFTTRSRG